MKPRFPKLLGLICALLFTAQVFAGIPATAKFEFEQGASDTANSGGFDPANASMATDLTATVATGSAPVVASASYNFVAGDVNNWLYIKAGTNWIPGWYQIASVASNKATLATACATTASPSGGTWTVDYSQSGSAAIAFTDLTAAGSGATLTSAAHPFGKNHVGNSVILASGTNVVTGTFFISGVTGTTASFDRSVTTGATSNGAGGLGGAKGSPGLTSSLPVDGNKCWIKGNSTYTTSTTTAGAGGPISLSSINLDIECYTSVRGDGGSATLSAGTQTSFALVTTNGNYNVAQTIKYLIVDGNSKTGVKGFNPASSITAQSSIYMYGCGAWRCPGNGFDNAAAGHCYNCFATLCAVGFKEQDCHGCIAYLNTSHGLQTSYVFGAALAPGWEDCGSILNGGKGFYAAAGNIISRCWTYENTDDGFDSQYDNITYNSCLSVLDGGYGFNCDNASRTVILLNCAARNTASGVYHAGLTAPTLTIFGAFTTLTGDPYVNAAGLNFALNNTTGAGAACRAAGFPSVYRGVSTTNYVDIGVQHQASGGGAPVFSPGVFAP